MTDGSFGPLLQVDVTWQRGNFLLQCRFDATAGSMALFGPSGAGKSTILGLVAGLIRPDSGRIVLDGNVLADTTSGIWVPAHRRRIGLVFQDSLLFPHLSVRGNLRYGLSANRRHAGDRPVTSFDEVHSLLGISHLLDRSPGTLSGGERQRVAIGRALLAGPRLLLLDEPLAALDYSRRQEIMPYLARIHREFGLPMVYVSHALEEVVRLADEVVLLDNGQVMEQGAPDNLLLPVSRDADGFGVVSVIEAVVGTYDPRDKITELAHPAGRISLPGQVGSPGDRHRVLVRATDVAISVSRPRDISHRTVLRGRITACHDAGGPLVRLDIALAQHGRIAALLTRRSLNELAVDTGDEVFALVKSTAIDDRAFGHAARAIR